MQVLGLTRGYKILLLVLLTILACSLMVKIDLTTADLGRHIKNGEIILTGSPEARQAVLTTNYYSYTEGDTPFTNHHWLSGVAFYTIFKISGFSGLSIFYILCMLAAFFIVFEIARRKVHPVALVASALFAIPLITSRAEVRPEAFTYLFLALFVWLCSQYYEGNLNKKWLWALPVLQLIWVNLHIGFVFGPFVIGVYLFTLLVKKDFSRAKTIGLILIASSIALLANPAFISGALYPFKIFGHYSYRVLENQSISFLTNLGVGNFYSFYAYKFFIGLVLVSFIFALVINWRKVSMPMSIFCVAFGVMGWLAIRDFPLFGLIAFVFFAMNMEIIYRQNHEKFVFLRKEAFVVLSSIVLITVGLILNVGTLVSRSNTFSIGLRSDASRAAEFFKENNLKGPIFNNYDVGGYLIYGLFPQEKVYFDNRPETYSSRFVDEDYIQAMEQPEIFQALDQKYKFNAIIFNYQDYTPWAQTFLARIVFDQNWPAVYADSSVLILLKQTPQNTQIIEKYRIPKDAFHVTQTP